MADLNPEERKLALGIGKRLLGRVAAGQRAHIEARIDIFSQPIASRGEGDVRGAFFELRIFNSLGDPDDAEFEVAIPGVQSKKTVDVYVPSREILMELQSRRSQELGSAQLGSHLTSEENFALLHAGMNASTDFTKDKAFSMAAIVNEKCAAKGLHSSTQPIWLITELFETDYLINDATWTQQVNAAWLGNCIRNAFAYEQELAGIANALSASPSRIHLAFSEYKQGSATIDRLAVVRLAGQSEEAIHKLRRAMPGVEIELL